MNTLLPDFNDDEWERMRVFHQMRVAVAVQGLLKHTEAQRIELPLGDFTVTITTKQKQVTQ